MKRFVIGGAACLLPWQAAAAQAPVFDVHVHLPKLADSITDYERQVKGAPGDVTGFAGMWFGGANQAKAGNPGKNRAMNDVIIALAAKNPKMLPVGTVHPYDGQAALDELRRLSSRGIKLIKIHPHTQEFDASDPRVAALARLAGELGIVILMDNANIVPGDNEKLFNLAISAPRTNFVFAHMGALNFRFWNILKLARTAENLLGNNFYFDISGIVSLAAGSPIEEEFVWTMRNIGVDQLLVGSDYPQMSLNDATAALDKLNLTPEEKAKIRYGNARKLLGLGDDVE